MVVPMATSISSLLFILLIGLGSPPLVANAHNITRILAKHPEFSTFNEYLTKTHLASEINRRRTITVLALDNAAMSSLLSKGFSLYTVRHVLSFHVLVDYFGAKKLRHVTNGTDLVATMFQSSGDASGTSGYVNITDLRHGKKVGLAAADATGEMTSFFVKSVAEYPYNISVIQVSQVIDSVEAEAPTPEPSLVNLTSLLAGKGCKVFAALLSATGADQKFQETIDDGLTIFCVGDNVVKAFMPKYKKLTESDQLSLLLYHAVPMYNSMQMLKSNGVVTTLATNGAKKYDFTLENDDGGEAVTLNTEIVTAKITGTLVDDDPLACYKLDKFLLPHELYKADPLAAAPKADLSDDDTAEDDDQTADEKKNAALRIDGGGFISLVLALCYGALAL